MMTGNEFQQATELKSAQKVPEACVVYDSRTAMVEIIRDRKRGYAPRWSKPSLLYIIMLWFQGRL